MQQAVPVGMGAMAAILNADLELAQAIAAEAEERLRRAGAKGPPDRQ